MQVQLIAAESMAADIVAAKAGKTVVLRSDEYLIALLSWEADKDPQGRDKDAFLVLVYPSAAQATGGRGPDAEFSWKGTVYVEDDSFADGWTQSDDCEDRSSIYRKWTQ